MRSIRLVTNPSMRRFLWDEVQVLMKDLGTYMQGTVTGLEKYMPNDISGEIGGYF